MPTPRRKICICLFLAVLGMAGICGSPSHAVEPAGRKPNIVMIFTDDQRHDAVGYAGNAAVRTPHLDSLARRGTVFLNCFVNTSICAVSRANLLSGQYPGRHGIDDFFKTFSPDQLSKTVPARLQKAGYQTAFFGKWGIGDSPEKTIEGAEVFDYWAGQPMQTCFFHDPGCRYVQSDGFARPCDNLCDCPADSRGVKGYRNRIGHANIPQPLHVDADVIPGHVERFLAARDRSQPFCLFLFFKAPHSPFQDWAPDTKHLTDDLAMPTPPGATLALAEREPSIVRQSLGRATGMQFVKDPATLQAHMRDYYRLIASMDRGVGKVMQLIAAEGETSNTAVLFTSDNGHFLGEHGLAGKWLMYEPSLRVPGFFCDLRKAADENAGQIRREMVITTDFSVTMLALAGLERPAEMEGMDLGDLATGDATEWRTDFYYDHPYGHGGQIPRTIGVRNERYAYIRYVDDQPPYEQVFDLHRDPVQGVNLLEEERSGAMDATLLQQLRDRCDALRLKAGG